MYYENRNEKVKNLLISFQVYYDNSMAITRGALLVFYFQPS